MTFNPNLEISLNESEISLNQLDICKSDISLNQLDIFISIRRIFKEKKKHLSAIIFI